jgi:hypothetical protein
LDGFKFDFVHDPFHQNDTQSTLAFGLDHFCDIGFLVFEDIESFAGVNDLDFEEFFVTVYVDFDEFRGVAVMRMDDQVGCHFFYREDDLMLFYFRHGGVRKDSLQEIPQFHKPTGITIQFHRLFHFSGRQGGGFIGFDADQLVKSKDMEHLEHFVLQPKNDHSDIFFLKFLQIGHEHPQARRGNIFQIGTIHQ